MNRLPKSSCKILSLVRQAFSLHVFTLSSFIIYFYFAFINTWSPLNCHWLLCEDVLLQLFWKGVGRFKNIWRFDHSYPRLTVNILMFEWKGDHLSFLL